MSLNIHLYAVRKMLVFGYNITHNLGRMAEAAGVYKALWRPEEVGLQYAHEMIAVLEEGLEKLRGDKEKYTMMNPSNGWGTYEDLIACMEVYLLACKEHPDAEIKVSR